MIDSSLTAELTLLESRTHIEKSHLAKISDYAKNNNLFISIRDLNPHIVERMSESTNYIGKDLHVKAKSSTIVELAGYIPVENRFAKKHDDTADEKMQKILLDPESKYRATPVVKVVNKNNLETKFTLCYDANKTENIFYYRNNETGKYYKTLDAQLEVEFPQENSLKAVMILSDENQNVLIPDYDLAIIGSNLPSQNSTHAELDEDLGRVPTSFKKDLLILETISNKMIRHGSDNYNPVSYQLEMSEESPYTCFLPNGKIEIANNPDEYLKIINQWRHSERNPKRQSYDLIINPRLGVRVDENGDIYLPKKENRVNWEELDKETTELKDSISKADGTTEKFKLGGKFVTEKRFLQEKYFLNKTIIDQYEKLQRTEMQEPRFKNTSDYQAYKESLENTKDGIKYMKKEYAKIFGEEPILSKYQDNILEKTQIIKIDEPIDKPDFLEKHLNVKRESMGKKSFLSKYLGRENVGGGRHSI